MRSRKRKSLATRWSLGSTPRPVEIENLKIPFFSTRLLRGDLLELPVTANLRIAG
jgi:hypothetical protein